jgi:DNA-directed RNA polymerase subunit RPC12/RpoP
MPLLESVERKVNAKMTQKVVHCLHCDAPLAIPPEHKHYRCPFCGSKFVVDWVDPEAPQLTGFETVLQADVDAARLELTSKRLAELAPALAEADEEVQMRRARLGRTHLAHAQALQEARQALEWPQGATLAVGLLASVVWFLVAFEWEGMLWYIGVVVGLVLVVLTWWLHRRWMHVDKLQQTRMQEALQTIEQADAALSDALARREDCRLEQELHQAQIVGQQSPGA